MPGPGRLGPRGFLTEEEKANVPKLTKGLLTRILSYLKPYRWQFVLVFITIIVSAVIGLLPSIITGRIVDEALVGKDMKLLIQLLIAALVCLTSSRLIGMLESYINSWISQRVIYDMKNQMYEHLEYMPHSFFTTEKQGDIITRMNTDISGVSSVISGTLSSSISNIATVVTSVVALFAMSPLLAVVGIVVLPLLVLPTRSAGKKRYTLLTKSQEKNDEMNQLINETLSVSGSMLVKLFTREKKEYEKFRKINKESTDLSLKEAQSGRWFMVIMGIFTQLGPLLIYFFGGLLIIRRFDPSLTVGTITATVALVNRLYRPVESLLNIHVDLTRSLALFTRIFDYLDRENTIKNPGNGKTPDVADADIVFSHVKFSYEKGDEILTDIDFTVPGGKMYAIVGPSGSGKSTIVNLIPRLYDVNGGSVSIGGTDVRDFDLSWLRRNIGMVTQDTYLFNGTILENLLYAKDEATREEVEEACRIANIHDFILAQPEGYDTVVGNRGLKLSGGEKQRLSIARVILKDPKILILDEATSALDSISESAIQDALETLMHGRTSIVIAHRLSTILKADSILVVKGGIIQENGPHDDLLKNGGVYEELYETQFRPALELEETEPYAGLNIAAFSSDYTVKPIRESGISDVYRLYRRNRQYYRSRNIRPSLFGLTDVVTDPSENTGAGDRLFVGFYDPDHVLTAILNLTLHYPEEKSAFIGWFMVDAEKHRRGIGSQIFADVRAALKAEGFDHLSLSCRKRNTDAAAFWDRQGFVFAEQQDEDSDAWIMERQI